MIRKLRINKVSIESASGGIVGPAADIAFKEQARQKSTIKRLKAAELTTSPLISHGLPSA